MSSFGASIRTLNGELLLDERFVVPVCFAIVNPTFFATHTLPGGNYVADEYVYPSPGFVDTRLDFWTLPGQPAKVWFTPKLGVTGYDTLQSSPSSYDTVFIFRPPGTPRSSVAVPTGYCFQTGQLSRSGETWGLAVWRADGSLAFELGNKHLQLANVLTSVGYPPSGVGEGTVYTRDVSGLPAVPAFFIGAQGSEVWVRNTGTQQSSCTFLNSAMRLDGATLSTTNIMTAVDTEDIALPGGTRFVGRSPMDLPVIDATNFSY